MKTPVLIFMLIVMCGMPTYADVDGYARVVDGDTLHFVTAKIRLHGIDAPEHDQTCPRGQFEWECGIWSARALKRLINGNQVRCTERGKDRYKRIIGV